jgi:hypothetical protein
MWNIFRKMVLHEELGWTWESLVPGKPHCLRMAVRADRGQTPHQTDTLLTFVCRARQAGAAGEKSRLSSPDTPPRLASLHPAIKLGLKGYLAADLQFSIVLVCG